MKTPKEITTTRLALRPVAMQYVEEVNAAMTDAVTKHMYMSRESLAETTEWFEKTIAKNQAGEQWSALVFDKATDELFGGAGIHHIDTKNPEPGIWLKESAWGHGYGREAIVALKEWADAELDYVYLEYPVVRKNQPSIKIAEFFGGRIEKEYMMDTPSGKKLDLVEYHIYKDKS